MTSKLSFKAILLGAVVDIAGSFLMGLLVLAAAALVVDTAGLVGPARTAAVLAAVRTRQEFYAMALLLGALCSVGGGYLAARIATRRPVAHGAWSAVLCVALSLLMMLGGDEVTSPALHLMFFGISPLLGALGGYWQGRRDRGPVAFEA